MCGRYALSSPPEVVAAVFGLASVPSLQRRHNIAPTEEAPVIRADPSGVRRLDQLRWGLIPFWTEEPPAGPPLINARSETAGEARPFREAFRRRRCLVPVSGFYEWQPTGGKKKQPFVIRRIDGQPFALAGLWERWRDKDGEVVESFTILTREPDELVKPIHDRMPAIVPAEHYGTWLDSSIQDVDRLQAMIAPGPIPDMEAAPTPSPERLEGPPGLF